MTDALANEVSSSLVSVSVRRLDIKYKVYEDQVFSARELVGRGFRSRKSTIVHAIKDLSFDFHIGEAVGIVGSNGSGKSTLLRAIAGLQSPASGAVFVRGEPHLLGVGAALKPALSGYRNVMLGGLAMGMNREEIEAELDGVREFSGLGEAMARPMNTYSSGMRARLSFSIATLRIPDVLLIDEALAVGDQDFRTRSLARINEIREEASTVVMVTHNVNEIRQTCTRCLWLDQGQLLADGEVDDVLQRYESGGSGRAG
ncbi:MAG TPA: ATP-binding cassette domain-containing protein [Acidimicrobiia bacterium]|nr:ATP-binding cassette domain-containing protein [Acidimicrobiia bacterium]